MALGQLIGLCCRSLPRKEQSWIPVTGCKDLGKINTLRGHNKAGEGEIATHNPKIGKLQGHLLCTGALCKVSYQTKLIFGSTML